jgi:hypothetical protein
MKSRAGGVQRKKNNAARTRCDNLNQLIELVKHMAACVSGSSAVPRAVAAARRRAAHRLRHSASVSRRPAQGRRPGCGPLTALRRRERVESGGERLAAVQVQVGRARWSARRGGAQWSPRRGRRGAAQRGGKGGDARRRRVAGRDVVEERGHVLLRCEALHKRLH